MRVLEQKLKNMPKPNKAPTPRPEGSVKVKRGSKSSKPNPNIEKDPDTIDWNLGSGAVSSKPGAIKPKPKK